MATMIKDALDQHLVIKIKATAPLKDFDVDSFLYAVRQAAEEKITQCLLLKIVFLVPAILSHL